MSAQLNVPTVNVSVKMYLQHCPVSNDLTIAFKQPLKSSSRLRERVCMHQEWIDYPRVLALLESAVLLHKTGGECARLALKYLRAGIAGAAGTAASPPPLPVSRYCGLSQ